VPTRPVYAIGAPHHENFLAKEERLVVGGAARPGCRRGLPLVSRFLPTRQQAKQYHNPASHHEFKYRRHRAPASTADTADC